MKTRVVPILAAMLFSVTVSAFAADSGKTGSEKAVSEKAGSEKTANSVARELDNLKTSDSEMTDDEVLRDEQVLREIDKPSTSGSEKTADAVARQLANPNNSLASLTIRNQYRWYGGDLPNAGEQGNYTMLFQPVFPFTLPETASGGKANLFIRPAIPVLASQPVFDRNSGNFRGVSALGDIGFDLAVGVTEKNGLLWAAGMVGSLPTATNGDVAGKQLRLGPELMFAKFQKWGIYGIFPSHLWNVAGWGGQQFSMTQSQVFLTVLPGGGWNIGSIPIISYDWKSDAWTVPFNIAVGRTLMFGATPVKVQLEVNYYVVHPDAFGPKWMVGLNITPVVPNVINSWIRGK